MTEKTVAAYIAQIENWQAEIVSKVRNIILETAPEADEAIKWAQPVYSVNGPFAYIKAFKNSVNFGFWRGVDIQDSRWITARSVVVRKRGMSSWSVQTTINEAGFQRLSPPVSSEIEPHQRRSYQKADHGKSEELAPSTDCFPGDGKSATPGLSASYNKERQLNWQQSSKLTLPQLILMQDLL